MGQVRYLQEHFAGWQACLRLVAQGEMEPVYRGVVSDAQLWRDQYSMKGFRAGFVECQSQVRAQRRDGESDASIARMARDGIVKLGFRRVDQAAGQRVPRERDD